MATPAERKAFLFVGVVALLGGTVRCWRARHAGFPSPPSASVAQDNGQAEEKAKKSSKRNSRSKKKALSDVDTTLDPASLVDLDVASVTQIEALGLLKPGQARQLVADRELYGPFGSIQALERVPYFPKSAIVKLAPRVTFSRSPRPANTVIQRRPEPPPPRRRARRGAAKAGS